ncbi:Tektin-2 [Fasciolopsis buskii]|uniref:Tektin n=1 Tax=Fasciolopsis buskii TaxID=27845 RepID=A0A8E0VHP3_9TREM|nr:Tektin-2 [Fasciolopsis buski]
MATLTKPEFKRSYPTWFTQIHTESRAATDARNDSASLRDRSRAIRIETDSKTKSDQYDTNNRLADRIWTVRQWRDQLLGQVKRLREKIVDLTEAKRNTENFMVKLADAQQVNTEALTFVDRRKQTEYVSDPVEVRLKEEQKLLKEIQKDLQSQILEAFETLKQLEKAESEFVGSIKDNEEAMRIDIDQYNLNERSAYVTYKPFATRKPDPQIDLQTWEDSYRAILDRAKAEVVRGGDLVHKLHLGLHQAANRMSAKAERVSDALRVRLHDTERAIRELQFQQQATEDERKKLLKELKFLEEAKRAKQASLKLAQTRLDARQYRPPPENSEDPVQAGLLEELSGLTDSIDALDEQIEKSRAMLTRLEKQLAALCQDLRTKLDTLSIFREVVNIRKRLERPVQTRFPPCPLIPNGVVRNPTIF